MSIYDRVAVLQKQVEELEYTMLKLLEFLDKHYSVYNTELKMNDPEVKDIRLQFEKSLESEH